MAGEPTWTEIVLPNKPWNNWEYDSYVITPTSSAATSDTASTSWLSHDGAFEGTYAETQAYTEAFYTEANVAEPLTIECKVLADLFDYEDPYGGPRLQAYKHDIIFMLEPQAVALVDAATAAGYEEAEIELIGTPTT